MTAIQMRGPSQRKSWPVSLEALTRILIILCTALAVLLSSIAVCDGHWLLSSNYMFGLWHLCFLREHDSAREPNNCTTSMADAGVEGLEAGIVLCRVGVSLSVVAAIFGLELLVQSQICLNGTSTRRWCFGAALVLLAAGLASGGVTTFVFFLVAHASPLGFTLTFWCQFAASFLFLLNGMAARHIQNMAPLLPFSGGGGKL